MMTRHNKTWSYRSNGPGPAFPAHAPAPHLRQVFISCRSTQKQAAIHLAAALAPRGIEAWWADKIENGKFWHGRIDDALAASGAVVVLWSKAAMASAWVRHEASQAVARGVYVPVKIEAFDLEEPFDAIQATDLPGLLDNPQPVQLQTLFQAIDAVLPPPLTRWEQLVALQRRHRALLSTVLFATAATVTLAWLAWTTGQQIDKLDALSVNLGKAQVETENVAAELSQTQKSVNRSIGQVEAIFKADLDWAYVLGVDGQRRGYLRLENMGAGVGTITHAEVWLGDTKATTSDAKDLAQLGAAFHLGANTIKLQQKVPPGRSITIFTIPAEYIENTYKRCIKDKLRKQFFEKLRIRITYTSTFDSVPRLIEFDYRNQNKVTCIRE